MRCLRVTSRMRAIRRRDYLLFPTQFRVSPAPISCKRSQFGAPDSGPQHGLRAKATVLHCSNLRSQIGSGRNAIRIPSDDRAHRKSTMPSAKSQRTQVNFLDGYTLDESYIVKPDKHHGDNLASIFAALEGDDEIIVGADTNPRGLFKGYAVVSVNDGVIDGLPKRASSELQSAILLTIPPPRTVSKRSLTAPVAATCRETVFPQAHTRPALLDHADILLGAEEHESIFRTILQRARERVIIHSTFISDSGWKRWMPAFQAVAARGIKVEIMWGQSDDENETSSSRRSATAFRHTVEASGRSALILVHPFTTRSHAKLLFGDDGQGAWIGIVGSCNWLSSDFDSFEASVRVRDPIILGEAVGHLGSLSLGMDGLWTPLAVDLTTLGRKIASMPRGNGRTAPMRLLLAPDHSALVLDARDRAQRRITVTSHRIGIAGRPMVILPVLAAAQARNVESALYYGRPTGVLSGMNAATLQNEFSRKGVNIRPVFRPRLHAKVLAWDDDALAVTSQNWLSADPSEGDLRREIGVYVELNKAAENFVRRFEHAQAV